MILLIESLRKTNCKAMGYTIGRIIIEEGKLPYLEVDETKEEIVLTEEYLIEIYNDDKWEQIEISDLERKTEWGWPLLAGFETRIKEREVK